MKKISLITAFKVVWEIILSLIDFRLIVCDKWQMIEQ